jgi:LacI family transcriptional regulator
MEMLKECKILNQERIYLDLKKRLESGVWSPQTQMPSLRELAGSFDSSPGTVRQALVKLQYEGLIEAHHGKGYFVCLPNDREIKNIMLLELAGNEHLYSNFVKEFRQYFSKHEEYMINLEYPCNYREHPRVSMEKLDLLCESGLEAIFIDGEQISFSKMEFKKLLEKTKLYYYFNEREIFKELNIPGVSTEWFHGAYIATRHLLEIGCRNILAVSGTLNKKAFENAIEDSAVNAEVHFIGGADKADMDEVAELLKSRQIDGFFAFGDCFVMKFLPLFREAGYRIPQDLAVVGYYNTPWCEHMEIPLTSVCLREAEMIKTVCDMYWGIEPERQVVIRPKMVIRDSTMKFSKTVN